MKKTLAIILVAVMLLSTLVALVVPAAAAGEGNWNVMLAATAEEGDPKNPPLAGYYYDETGFHTSAPNYKDYNPKFSVVSKEMYNIKDFSMTVVVHDYSIVGDNWFSFTIWSDYNGFCQGYTDGDKGDGWTSLIRPGADGNVNRLESWNQTKGGRSGKQSFTNIDGTQNAPIVFEPIVDAETGDFTITFEIKNGVVSVNGSVIGAGTDSCIADRFTSGLAYVGVTVHNTDASGTHNPSVSIIDVNGMTPEGSDSRDPEGKVREIAPIAPSDSVPKNEPAIWFDGTLDATNVKLPTGSNCDIDFADDNESILITAGATAFYMQFEVPDNISYEAADFTYIAFIFKNFCTCNIEEGENLNDACTGAEVGSIWYCAGEVTSARNDCANPIPMYYNVTPMDEDWNYLYEDMYTVGIIAVANDLWAGRIHSLRLDVGFYNNYGVDGLNQFEIMGAGIFRSGDEMANFLDDYKDLGFDTEYIRMDYSSECDHFDWDEDGLCDICFEDMNADPGIPGEPETEAPETEAPTEAPSETESETVAPEESSADETVAPEESSADETVAPEESSADETVAPEESSADETVAPEESSADETVAPEESSADETVAPEESSADETVAPEESSADETVAPEESSADETVAPEETSVDETVAPEETSADVAPEETTAADVAPEDTTAAADVTTKEETTTAKEETTTKAPATSDDTKTEEKKGCGSSVAMGALAIVAIVGTGVVLKKKED